MTIIENRIFKNHKKFKKNFLQNVKYTNFLLKKSLKKTLKLINKTTTVICLPVCIYIAAWREREELWSTPRVASGSCTLLKIDIKVSGLIKECSGVEENLPSESRYKDYLLYWKIKSRYKKKNKRNGIEKN